MNWPALRPNITVLLAGGEDQTCTSDFYECSDATAEVYDPAAGSFTATGSLIEGRFWHAATLLPDGRVLITGGVDRDAVLATAEIYH